MEKDIERILLTEEDIQQKIKELANIISEDYKGKKPIMICILKGAAIFMTNLITKISIPLEIDFLSVSSYGKSTTSSGVVKIRKDIDSDINKRHIIIVEDILDSGLTLKYIGEYLLKHNPLSIRTCVLLDKPKAHKTKIKIDYIGFEVGNEFLVGFGLDYAEKYRNLPYIGILKKEIYS